jgi:hypothetical protein
MAGCANLHKTLDNKLNVNFTCDAIRCITIEIKIEDVDKVSEIIEI